MAEQESYVTKENPTAEDWLAYNGQLFTDLKESNLFVSFRYAPFTDVDLHAKRAGVSTEEFFEDIKGRVGPLGKAALQLVHSEMDDAWHIVVGPNEESQN